jgi:hypothetical protein
VAVRRTAVIGCVGLTFVLGAGSLFAQGSARVTPVTGQFEWEVTPARLTDAAWHSMSATIERDQYRLRREGDVYLASNHAQRLEMDFTKTGVEVTPQGTERTWRWGLRLAGYGYGDRRAPVARPQRVMSRNRIEYRRGDLVEWYVNARDGVEHGFTLKRPPAGRADDEPLTVDLRATGDDLRPSVADDGQSVAWRDRHGETMLVYNGLKVWDATGRTLVARMESADGGVRLHVDDVGAHYPVTIDPTILQGKLTASDGIAGFNFGWSVSIDDDTAIVGAPVGTSGGDSGAAYVFYLDPGSPNGWTEVAKLTPSDAGAPGGPRCFGDSVAISGDTAIVGAPCDPGAAYVFSRDHGGLNQWGEVKKLVRSNGSALRFFGRAVAIDGGFAVVGAATAAFIFSRDFGGISEWGEVHLIASAPGDRGNFGSFGSAVSISGGNIVVGNPGDNAGANESGAAYIFTRGAGCCPPEETWGLVKKLKAADVASDARFGTSVSISGTTVLIGAPGDAQNRRAAYVFAQDRGGPGAWGAVKKIQSADAARFFGRDVSLDQDLAVVGAYGANNGFGDFSGAAYVFGRNQGGPNAWGPVAKVAPIDDAISGNLFALKVSISGSTVLGGLYPKEAAYVCELDDLEAPDAACRRAPLVLDHLVKVSNLKHACCASSEFVITATFTNGSATPIYKPSFIVAEITGGNVLKNADGGPAGVGATLTPYVADEILSPGESIDVGFVIGLSSRQPFRFFVHLTGQDQP